MFSWKVVYGLNPYAEKCSAGKWYMDGWIKLQKKEKLLFAYEVQMFVTILTAGWV